MSSENTPTPTPVSSDLASPAVHNVPPRLLALSGLMLAGKDFVAAQCGARCFNPADPIYILAQRILGTADKSAPGVRRFMQLVGQWGWGCVTQDYPHTVERALFIDKLRYMGLEGGWMPFPDQTGMPMDALLDFGRSTDFWINIVLHRMEQVITNQKHRQEWLQSGGEKAQEYLAQRPNALEQSRRPLNLCVSSVRYEHELAPLKAAGFVHLLVMCSEETRRERMAAKGYTSSATEVVDISEQLARQLATTLDDRHIIWNDHRPRPEGKDYLSVEEFVKLWAHEVPVA